jgi:hypothetical protein
VDQSETNVGVPALRVATEPANGGETLGPIERLPKELGALLVVAGIGGLLLPGPVGTPFLIVGGVILWPAAFKRVEACFQKRLPRMHKVGMKQMKRFITDLERRYPWTGN